jgi:hypothetical protein
VDSERLEDSDHAPTPLFWRQTGQRRGIEGVNANWEDALLSKQDGDRLNGLTARDRGRFRGRDFVPVA